MTHTAPLIPVSTQLTLAASTQTQEEEGEHADEIKEGLSTFSLYFPRGWKTSFQTCTQCHLLLTIKSRKGASTELGDLSIEARRIRLQYRLWKRQWFGNRRRVEEIHTAVIFI